MSINQAPHFSPGLPITTTDDFFHRNTESPQNGRTGRLSYYWWLKCAHLGILYINGHQVNVLRKENLSLSTDILFLGNLSRSYILNTSLKHWPHFLAFPYCTKAFCIVCGSRGNSMWIYWRQSLPEKVWIIHILWVCNKLPFASIVTFMRGECVEVAGQKTCFLHEEWK